MVFLLNTRGLGDVKVQLQVWKSDCQCKVSVGTDEAGKFIEAEGPQLAQGFAQNTPFTLSKFDVSSALTPLKRALDIPDEFPNRPMSGLNLTA